MNNLRDQSTIFGLSFGGLTATYFRHQTSKYFKNTALQPPAFYPCLKISKYLKNTTKKDLNTYVNFGTAEDTENQDLRMI